MLTEEQKNILINDIFKLLMQHPDADISEMNNCITAAEILVNEYIEKIK